MNLMRVHRTFPRLKNVTRCKSQLAVVDPSEYTETPEYPPILDMSILARKRRNREAIYEKIRKIKTVEEKQIALNMPRYYGFKCVMFNENKVPYNALPMVQYYTRSHFQLIDKLPEIYAELEPASELVAKEVKPLIEEAIAFETECVEYNNKESELTPVELEDEKTKRIIKQINRIITNNLADKSAHILSAQVDYEPRHEAFWFVGGIDVPLNVQNWRKKYPWLKDRIDENIDRPVQYLGSPLLTMRSHFPLKPILPYSEATNPEFKVKTFTCDPVAVKYFLECRHGTNMPGFWPGEHDEFGLLSYHKRGHILTRPESFGSEDNIEALHCQALKASFGWLLAQANYQGFTTFNDITYPLSTQTVITNGQMWSFYAYQLNTIEFHNEKAYENPKHNVCFGTLPMKLYETVEGGNVKGLNEDILKMLIQFYVNAPEQRDYNMKPFLAEEEKVIADIEDDNRRCWLEDRYKHLCSNRPRHLLPYEEYYWEKIYKIWFNTRFFERKNRPFNKGINPYSRRLDEHLPPYIPKVKRPYPRARKKFETTYYPDV